MKKTPELDANGKRKFGIRDSVAYAAGDAICGKERFQKYVDGARELWKKAKDGVDKVNETLGIGVAVTKGINEITKLFTSEEDE